MADERIKVTVFGLDTNLSVLMRSSVEMEKLMEVFAAKSGIAMDSLRYLLLRSYFSVKFPVAISTQLNFCGTRSYKNIFSVNYATLKFQPIRETEKRSRDDLDVTDWLKFQRSLNYAENNVYRIGSRNKVSRIRLRTQIRDRSIVIGQQLTIFVTSQP